MNSHFSHLLIGLFLISILTLGKFLFKDILTPIAFSRILIISSIVIASWISLPIINYIVEKKITFSKGNHVFLMAHLNDTGILKKILDENCSNPEFKDCKLCQYKDSLPTDLASFIWTSKILSQTGGWFDSEKEYNKIIATSIKKPKYLILNIYKSITYGFIQLAQINIGQGVTAYNKGSAPYGQIYWRFNHELNNYLNSKQNIFNGINLKSDTLNLMHRILIIFSFVVLIFILSNYKLNLFESYSLIFLIFVIVSIFLNAFLTAGLNSPCDRFQSRIIWLLPLAITIFIIKNHKILFNNLNTSK